MESSSSSSPATSVTPARSVSPATADNAAPSPGPSRTSATPAIESPTVLDTTNPTSRRFPMMGPGVGTPPVVDQSDPQVIAAKASNDGSATHDHSKAYAVVTPSTK